MHNRIVSLAILFCIYLVGIPVFADANYDAGVASYRNGKYQEAFDLLLKSLDKDPHNADAYYVMALTCQQMGKFVEARSYYQFVVDHFPTSKAFPMASKAAKQLAHVRAPVSPAPATAARSAKVVVTGRPEIEKAFSADVIPANERIPFSREQNDKVMVVGSLNGRPLRMCIDTGAYEVFFGKNHLRAAGIKPPEGKPTHSSWGVSGKSDEWEMPLEIVLGKIRITVNARIAEDLDYPLIGQTFLKKMHYEIDNANHYISFSNTSISTAEKIPEGSIEVPFRMVYNNLIVEAEVNGIPVEMNFDTGAGDCIFSLDEAEAYRLRPVSTIKFSWARGTGDAVPALFFQVPSIELGPISKRNVKVIVTEQGGGSYPVIGQSFFGNSRYIVDNKKKVIRFYR